MRSRLDELKKNKDLPSMLDAVEKVLDSVSLSVYANTGPGQWEIATFPYGTRHALGFILGFRFKQNFIDTKISIKY